MSSVDEVEQLNDEVVRFIATIAGVRREFDAKIEEQRPDHLVRWSSMDGVKNRGQISFESLGTNATRVAVEIVWEPSGILETAASIFTMDHAAVRKDLDNFKEFIEDRGQETGQWRGHIDNDRTETVAGSADYPATDEPLGDPAEPYMPAGTGTGEPNTPTWDKQSQERS
ncbi:hypothetical protein GCM10009569_04890 [Arthrobacter russicus]|jgi:hypothetical protein|uniref:Polyketide cyclase / dehydrase and lipid transport n=1 Tax=Arthrobacter russicus TaxID=172040 RepID=A0ABU1JFX5_9MICC|nr:hypothetical protein [Arthrobacter russicus]